MKEPGLLDPGSEGYELKGEVVIDPNESIQFLPLVVYLGIAWVIGDKVEAGISIVILICGGAKHLCGRTAVARII